MDRRSLLLGILAAPFARLLPTGLPIERPVTTFGPRYQLDATLSEQGTVTIDEGSLGKLEAVYFDGVKLRAISDYPLAINRMSPGYYRLVVVEPKKV
jgi:hypothetical protein